ncbi:hypothetical protein P8452_20598 [Trifolium repens]|nr:hypothetical protein P8452_20598 [Trifolium repens]
MVQDAKPDLVKQLLKAIVKYLQKFGSKLQEAKAAAGHKDDSDQAKASLLQSNEKYYKMTHSVKESIAEQPLFFTAEN